MTYTTIPDVQALLPDVPDKSIVSRNVYKNARTVVTLFGFAPGEALTEHTAAHSAILHFLSGEAALTLGDDVIEAKAGTWVQMPAHLRHSVTARTAVMMLLYLFVGE